MPPPPPPPFMPAPMICLFLRRAPGSAGSTANCEVIMSRAIRHCISDDRYEKPWQPAVANGAEPTLPPPGVPPMAMPRLPSESASSKKTITPP